MNQVYEKRQINPSDRKKNDKTTSEQNPNNSTCAFYSSGCPFLKDMDVNFSLFWNHIF